jgi:hypothetical protein
VWVRVVLPSLAHLMRHGILPTRLRDAALQGHDPKWVAEPEYQAERESRVGEYLTWLVSYSVREVQVDGEWVRAHLSPETVVDMDELDRDRLEEVALRDLTPTQATIASIAWRRSQGLPVPEEPEDDGEVSIRGWAAFRQRGRDPGAGDDGQPVGRAPEQPVGAGG